MEKYNEFRDTGLPWVEKIPKGWKLVKIKYVLKERIEKNNPMKTENILSLTAKQGVVPYDQKEGVATFNTKKLLLLMVEVF